MSRKPAKKSDIDKDWMNARKSRNIKIRPEFHLIVTEGKKTEPYYFEAFKDIINMQYQDKQYIEVHGTGDNTVNLIDISIDLCKLNPNGYRHVWFVYDIDDFPAENINKVDEWCKNNSTADTEYHAIWSNQCIELWFLLHFSYFQADLHRDEYFPKLSECLKKLNKGKYTKNRKDMYEILQPLMKDAISNAKKLDKINIDKTPADSAPGTKVYTLVEYLLPYLC